MNPALESWHTQWTIMCFIDVALALDLADHSFTNDGEHIWWDEPHDTGEPI